MFSMVFWCLMWYRWFATRRRYRASNTQTCRIGCEGYCGSRGYCGEVACLLDERWWVHLFSVFGRHLSFSPSQVPRRHQVSLIKEPWLSIEGFWLVPSFPRYQNTRRARSIRFGQCNTYSFDSDFLSLLDNLRDAVKLVMPQLLKVAANDEDEEVLAAAVELLESLPTSMLDQFT